MICLALALVYIDASVWQMLRGSIIVFTGLLSVSRHFLCFCILFIMKNKHCLAFSIDFLP